MTHFEMRKAFLDFFQSKGHIIEKSDSLIPSNDPSLLFTSAGMVPFKDFFLGKIKTDKKRRTSIQKCVRTNDIENIGITSRHLSFFEMLGNFSFGDYFKKEAIFWAFEFLTEVLKLDKSRLYITIYKDDDEAFKIWEGIVVKNRIIRLGEDSNFWSIGKVGPCGPCSEILYDRGEEFGCKKATCAPGCDCDRYLEIWNLVFTQFERNENNNLLPLKQKNIDTGMGLERILSVLQSAESVFETDVFKPIFDKILAILNKKNIDKKALRIISDHMRSSVFMISDGVLPENEGRGYVLKRLIRRAIMFGNKCGLYNFCATVAEKIIEIMSVSYEDLSKNKNLIINTLASEETKFANTISNAEKIFYEICNKTKEKNLDKISGEDTFLLFDTFGLPVDIIEELAKENNLKIDYETYKIEMQKQKEKSRNFTEGWHKEEDFVNKLDLEIFNEKQNFRGYVDLEIKTEVLQIFKIENDKISFFENNERIDKTSGELGIILKETPFFTESGGQKSDIGTIEILNNDEKVIFSVEKSKKYSLGSEKKYKDNWAIHFGKIVEGKLVFENKNNFFCTAKVDQNYRNSIKKNHTAVHLLQATLRKYLGNNVSQKGSEVRRDGFRFDFNFTSPVSKTSLEKIEEEINKIILYNYPVETLELGIDDAKKTGALSFFNDKYGEIVRVVSIGEISKEFCAGTHVKNTSEIGIFKILSESGISSGIRRIEGTTGIFAYKMLCDFTNKLQGVKALLKNNNDNILEQIENTLKQNKFYEAEIHNLKSKILKSNLEKDLDLLNVENENKIVFLVKKFEKINTKIILDVIDDLKTKIKEKDFLFCFFVKNQEKLNFLILTNANFKDKNLFSAKDLLIKLKEKFNFSGGGKENLVQGNAIPNLNLDEFSNFIKSYLKL